MHINCGGEKSTVGNVVYEGDQYEGGAAKFHPMTDYWGFSSTGHFWDHNRTINDYIAQNVSVLGMNHSELYTRARLSPLTFTYLLWALLSRWELYSKNSLCRDNYQRQ